MAVKSPDYWARFRSARVLRIFSTALRPDWKGSENKKNAPGGALSLLAAKVLSCVSDEELAC
jgi:hypothetical protein